MAIFLKTRRAVRYRATAQSQGRPGAASSHRHRTVVRLSICSPSMASDRSGIWHRFGRGCVAFRNALSSPHPAESRSEDDIPTAWPMSKRMPNVHQRAVSRSQVDRRTTSRPTLSQRASSSAGCLHQRRWIHTLKTSSLHQSRLRMFFRGSVVNVGGANGCYESSNSICRPHLRPRRNLRNHHATMGGVSDR